MTGADGAKTGENCKRMQIGSAACARRLQPPKAHRAGGGMVFAFAVFALSGVPAYDAGIPEDQEDRNNAS
ncbi:hypothetical protein HUS70_04400 [Pandoraea nosoerga]|uniref:hypothetical protein n=1 Tax=Pandoraea nosoerga TaxID=2508296 RepID=UPI00123FB06D|nr:hypothetical protein [Pandoraea nosoerga]MBN4665226.1 hypothetical protein [Pandoraea nosoerga]MBN4674627.1 hypothetical protein [Pandoraea nosoerga]MBN4680515.1 hypothetical protein [Pandoraea nosoerga]MBN4743920.1 hypothetical protein [Pandoraea nosoerga]